MRKFPQKIGIREIFSDPEKKHGAEKKISDRMLFFRKENLSKFHPFYITPSFRTHRVKIDLADSEKRTPEVKFRPFFIIIPKKVLLTMPHQKEGLARGDVLPTPHMVKEILGYL